MLKDLAVHCDFVSLRYDVQNGVGNVLGECVHLLRYLGLKFKIIPGNTKWNRWNWREELWSSVKHLRPAVTLFPDHDEKFGAEWWDGEIDTFIQCAAVKSLFTYEMATVDGRHVLPYPAAPHCKAFKWDSGISFQPYHGYAIPNYPGVDKFESCYSAASKMWHYCSFTKSMEANKQLHK